MSFEKKISSQGQAHQTYFHVVYSPFDKKWHINVTKSRDIAFDIHKEPILQKARDFAYNQKDSHIIFHR